MKIKEIDNGDGTKTYISDVKVIFKKYKVYNGPFHITYKPIEVLGILGGPTKSLAAKWKEQGLCPECGHKGEWIALALICPNHGKFAG